MLRHTRATEDSRLFTDREMMMLFGWDNPDTISVYSHLSMRDVEEKDLVLHGLKLKEEVLKPIVQVQKCSSCGTENAPVAVYCSKCGGILASAIDKKTQQLTEDMRKRNDQMHRLTEKLTEATKKLEELEKRLKKS